MNAREPLTLKMGTVYFSARLKICRLGPVPGRGAEELQDEAHVRVSIFWIDLEAGAGAGLRGVGVLNRLRVRRPS